MVRLVLSGYASAEIAQELGIASFTVQDHLKKIFEKVGVRSRRALVARVLGEHHLPRLGSGARQAASGWFAPEA